MLTFNAWYTNYCAEVENFICLSKNLNARSYLKNHSTNTRFVCTHFDAFFMLNLNDSAEYVTVLCKNS